MARPKLADEIQKVKSLATDPAKTPRARILAARRLIREFGFSTRSLRVANKIAKLFLSDMGISIEDRKSAQSLFEYIHDHQPTHEDAGDDSDVAEDTQPTSGTVEPVTPKGPVRVWPGFATFEQLLPHIPGLENLDLDHPSGFEYGNSTHDKRQALCCRLGLTPPICRRQMIGDLDRGCADNETIRKAIVSWANRVIDVPLDVSKPQARLVGLWRLKYTEHNARYSEFSKWLQDDDDKYYENEKAPVTSERIPPRVDVAPDPIGPAEFRPDLSVPPGAVVPKSEF